MNDISVFSYGVIPRKCDRAKAYLYFKGWASRFFEFEGARSEDELVRVVLSFLPDMETGNRHDQQAAL